MELVRLANKYITKKIIFTIFVIFSMINALINIVIPYITGEFIDFLVYLDGESDLVKYCVIFATACIGSIIINYVLSRLSLIIIKTGVFNLQEDAINKLERTYMLKFAYDTTAELSHKLSYDSNAILNFYVGTIQNAMSNLVTVVISIMFLSIYNFKIAIAVSILNIVYFLVYKFFKNPIRSINQTVRDKDAIYFAELNNRIIKVPFIKSNGYYRFFAERLSKVFYSIYESYLKLQVINYLFYSLDKIILMIAQILLFIYGGYQVVKGNLTIGSFTVISTYFTMILTSIRYFFGVGKEYQEIKVSVDRVLNILSLEKEDFGELECGLIEDIEVKNIDFSYDNNNFIFCDFSYIFKRGNIYLIRGKNGTGKSTLLKILSTLFYYPNNKNMKINGIFVEEHDLNYLRSEKISFLEQDPVIVNGTIRDNLFNSEIDYKLFNTLVNVLNMEEFLLRFNMDIDEPISEKKVKLSGGEKQKIGLLRVLLKKADVVILDEPTSSLDDVTKNQLINYLSSIKNDKIIIISAHDLIVEKMADKLITI